MICIWSSHPRFLPNIVVHWRTVSCAAAGAYFGSLLSFYWLFPGVVIGALFSILSATKLAVISDAVFLDREIRVSPGRFNLFSAVSPPPDSPLPMNKNHPGRPKWSL